MAFVEVSWTRMMMMTIVVTVVIIDVDFVSLVLLIMGMEG